MFYKIISVLALLVLASSLLFGQAEHKRPDISFEEAVYDFGKIPEEGGSVTHKFVFTNTGDDDLIIRDVKSPCGCTVPDWTAKPVPPGESGSIKATFNPLHRVGPFSKTLTVTTNMIPGNKYIVIKGEVLPKKRSIEDVYPVRLGYLRFKSTYVYFGTLKSNEVDTLHVQMYNAGEETITINQVFSQSPVESKILDKSIEPGKTGKILVTYYASAKNDFGSFSDPIEIRTDDRMRPVKKIMANATIEQYFPPMTPDEMKAAPKVAVDREFHNFGLVGLQETLTASFTITNKGEEPLKIIKVKPSCGCTATSPGKDLLAEGESTELKLEFNTSAAGAGIKEKYVTVFTNDPTNSSLKLTIKANIADK